MPTSRTEAQAGFTLLELLAVLVIVALAASAVLSVGRSSLESARVRSFLIDSEAMFREARTAAIARHVPTAVVIDTEGRRLNFPATGRSLAVPPGVTLDARVAQSEDGAPPAIRFFPSGASSGGELSFQYRGRAYALRVNWLTGRTHAEAL